MKKTYFKLKLRVIALVVVVLLLGCGMLTYQRADHIRDDYSALIMDDYGFERTLRLNSACESDDFIQQVYYEYCKVGRDSDIGFYSMLKDGEGNTLAEDQNFMIVKKADDNEDENDWRVLLLEESFGHDDFGSTWSFANGFFSKMEIIGTCDDTYIYLDELKWTNTLGDESYSYVPKIKEDNVAQKKEKFEDWSGSRLYGDYPIENKFFLYINSVYPTYGDDDKNMELNREAEEICQQIYDDYYRDIDSKNYQSEEGIFTTYIGGTGHLSDEYAIPYVFVFHPISIAVSELAGIYVLAFILGIVIVCILCHIIQKTYLQQLAYDNNRRQLTRGIAHELKTPLAITKGYVENWEYLDEENRHESSKKMIDEIEHMNRMVTDLLELSHLEAKTKEMNMESVDIKALTNSVLKRMKATIEDRGIVVSGNIRTGSGAINEYLVEADLEMMRTVLVNFISNGVKYAEKEIEINLSEVGKRFRFTITNDGQTIETDKINKVWDEFYRDATVDTKRIGGSGLGLAITKNILLLHGAKYGCQSENGKTTFWFEMKCNKTS